jgi:hypothetical protein
MTMLTTANDLYALATQKTTFELEWELDGFIQEVGFGDIPEGANTRVNARLLDYKDFDGNRIWELMTVWLDDQPFMVVQCAGRSGQDHRVRFITNETLYAQAVEYLRSLERVEVMNSDDVIGADEPRADLATFYGRTLPALTGSTDTISYS